MAEEYQVPEVNQVAETPQLSAEVIEPSRTEPPNVEPITQELTMEEVVEKTPPNLQDAAVPVSISETVSNLVLTVPDEQATPFLEESVHSPFVVSTKQDETQEPPLIIEEIEDVTEIIVDQQQKPTEALVDQEKEQTEAFIDQQEEQNEVFMVQQQEQTEVIVDQIQEEKETIVDEKLEKIEPFPHQKMLTEPIIEQQKEQIDAFVQQQEQTDAASEKQQEQIDSIVQSVLENPEIVEAKEDKTGIIPIDAQISPTTLPMDSADANQQEQKVENESSDFSTAPTDLTNLSQATSSLLVTEINSTEDMDSDITSAILETSGDYKNVPPPASLTTTTGDVQFHDAMAKVKAIAAKLQQQAAAAAQSASNNVEAVASPSPSGSHQGIKRSHEDSYSSHGTRDSSREDYREDYRRDYRRPSERNRYEDYGRDSKRTAYDSGSSRPEYDSGRHRYGLGSEERRAHHSLHYGPSADNSRSGNVHEEFKVPNAVVGLVIGRGGENLKRIEKTTGARIQFSQGELSNQPPDVVERRVTITGTMEDVQAAKAMIQQLVDDATSGNTSGRRDSFGPSRTTITIHIPSSKVGVVIGRGGETIRDLQDRSGARINVTPDSAASPNANDRPVTLIGDDNAVQRAKALIDEIVNTGDQPPDRGHPKDYPISNYASGGNSYGHDSHGSGNYGGSGHYGGPPGPYNTPPPGKSSQETVTIQVPNDTVGLIIGKGGETVRLLQQQSGAKIQIEPVHGPPPADRNVHIIGTAENVSVAKSLILEKAASGNRERPLRHDQGRGDYGQIGYQQSSGYQQGGYQQTNYHQQGSSNYQHSGGYQQSSYPTNTYPQPPSQQTTYGQSNPVEYNQPSHNTGHGVYAPSTTSSYGNSAQQSPVTTNTVYPQYGTYTQPQASSTYNQYPAQPQYAAYAQQTPYSQQQPQQAGQPTVQVPNMGPPAQNPVQTQVATGYYQQQSITTDPTKSDSKPDPQTASTAPYGYPQYAYSYGTASVAPMQYQQPATQPTVPTTNSAAATYQAVTSGYATVAPVSSVQGSADQTHAAAYANYYAQYPQDQYNQQNYYQQYYQQQQQTSYNYQTPSTNGQNAEAPK
ncbi:hypothetical protein G9A89_000062 [Geosiphon pyriformis]|nr:hypothetical protein G9A89_000062 [Geosiphon pyriformis]